MCSSPADITAKALSRTYKTEHAPFKNAGYTTFWQPTLYNVHVTEEGTV